MNPQPTFPTELCFLSEFDHPGLRWLVRYSGWFFACWAVLVLWLGDQVGGNAMAISYTATAEVAPKHPATVSDMYGHLSNANSGLYHLFISPLLFLFTYHFHLAAGRAFIRLKERGILQVNSTTNETWDAIIRRRNHWVGVGTLWLFIPIFAISLKTQLSSLEEGTNGLPVVESAGKTLLVRSEGEMLLCTYEVKMLPVRSEKDTPQVKSKRLNNVGYNQSPNHERWVKSFNDITAQESRLKVLEAQEASQSGLLSQRLFAELDRQNLLNPEVLKANPKLKSALDFHEGKPVSLRLKDAVAGDNPAVTLSAQNMWPKTPLVRTGKISEYFQSLLNARSEGDEKHNSYMFWFKVFIILDQLRIAALYTFMAWLVAKFTFYLVQICRMLPEDPSAGSQPLLYFRPWARDGQGKFGLGDLFVPYNWLVLCISLGSFYGALFFPEGGGLKAFTQASGAGSGMTRFMHLLAVIAALSGMLIGPLWYYPRRLEKWLEATRLRSLRLRQARTKKYLTGQTRDREWSQISQEETEVLSQTTWPKGDKWFQLSMLAIFTVLLLPLGTAGGLLPEGVTKYARLPQYLRAECKKLAAWVYDLEPAKENTRKP